MIPRRWVIPPPRRLLTSLNLLRLIWVLLFYRFEHFIYRHAIEKCSWPVDGPREHRLALIADPQIVDENTYTRRGIAMWLTKVFTDRYMRRNWRLLMGQKPGTVIFLGDLMDGGREWGNDKYIQFFKEIDKFRWFPEFERFWKVFPRTEGVRIVTTLPGNHDIGLGDGIQQDRLTRFKSFFTDEFSTSQTLEICNFELILLDTPSLLNKASPEILDPPTVFLDNITGVRPAWSRLLFTHIPMYRPPDTECGPLRESSQPIRIGGGYQYQNILSEDLSMRIFDVLWPVSGVFSGDDHDYCLAEHEVEGRRELVPEYTLKSFNWAMVCFPY